MRFSCQLRFYRPDAAGAIGAGVFAAVVIGAGWDDHIASD
jgi:hypothetical protein